MATGIGLSWNPMASNNDWRLMSSTMPPPVPARTHRHNLSLFSSVEADSDAYLLPLTDCHHLDPVTLPVRDGGPPLPPRQPLQRSMSLTHRPPPQPVVDDSDLPSDRRQALADMVNALRLARNQRSAQLTPAASAPLLSQVVPISRWPIRDQSASPVRVIPLSHWPLVDTAVTRRLVMDGIVGRGTPGSTNEYVEGPTLSQKENCGQRRRARHKVTTTILTGVHVAATPEPPLETSDRQSNVQLNRSAERREENSVRHGGFANKIRRILLCGSGSGNEEPREPSNIDRFCQSEGSGLGGTVCRRCGQCRCSECLHAEESATLCRARTIVDTATCMCCVRSVFYHCTKDDAGQDDDCSDAPCACCERPHCIMRWTIIALLLPCLPCLCLYPPLSCTVEAVFRRRRSSKACHCARMSRSSGLKSLLESESSSA